MAREATKVAIGKKYHTLIDREDEVLLKSWGRLEVSGNGYVHVSKRVEGRRVRTYLHRLITNAPEGKVVDHINRNPLDNRKSNLRILDKRFNHYNDKVNKQNKSGYANVSWHKECSKWQVTLKHLGKQLGMGLFADLEDAASCAYSTRFQLREGIIGEFSNG